jgi:hydroxylamine reductase
MVDLAESTDNKGRISALAGQVSIPNRFIAAHDDEAMSLAELCMYGLKGAAAYAHHASQLGYTDAEVFAFMHKALNALANPKPVAGEMLGLAMEIGKANVQVMGLLDRAHTTYVTVLQHVPASHLRAH